MRWHIKALLVSLAFLVSSQALAAERVALVIGNGAYRYAKALPNPANDASAMVPILEKMGFEVIHGSDLDKRAMEDKIVTFGRRLDDAKIALFFYAGHGVQVEGKNYLLPVDARLQRVGDLSFETIGVNQVLAQMEAVKRTNLVFLDSCRDNPLSRSLAARSGSRSASVGQGLASVQGAIGTMIAFATQPDNVAEDGTGAHSPFTSALLKHISTPGLEIRSVMTRVRVDVLAATNDMQVPWDHSSLIGDVVLAGLPAGTATDASAAHPARTSADAIAWEFVRDSGSIDELTRFLSRYPASRFREEAQQKLDRLRSSPLRVPSREEAAPPESAMPLPPVRMPATAPAQKLSVAPATQDLKPSPVKPVAMPPAPKQAKAAPIKRERPMVERPASPRRTGGCFMFNGNQVCD